MMKAEVRDRDDVNKRANSVLIELNNRTQTFVIKGIDFFKCGWGSPFENYELVRYTVDLMCLMA